MTIVDVYTQIRSAADLLAAGGTVAFPTETVYGIGADVSNAGAVQRIFSIKGRPANHPLIVHFGDLSQLRRWVRELPEPAWLLAEYFWPGPLTLVLPRSEGIPTLVTGGQDTVGLRVPDHPVALALLKALGPERALAAPSANRFGRVSPTTAAHVHEELGHEVDLILDGGACKIGLESTIVGFQDQKVTLLRPGGIPVAALEKVLKGNVVVAGRDASAVRVPGALASHYAPSTPMELCSSAFLWQRARALEAAGLRVMILERSMTNRSLPDDTAVECFSMPNEPARYGQALYATLRRFDQGCFDRFLVESPPEHPSWMAISDRLQRASCQHPVSAGGGERS